MRYKVIFIGKIAEGFVAEKVKKSISDYFKLDAAAVEKLFSGKPITIKNNTDRRTALEIKTAMEKAGALCRILNAEKNEHKTLQGKAKGTVEYKTTGDDRFTCPKCGFHQKKTKACSKCGVIFKNIKNVNVTTRNTAQEKKADRYSSLGGLKKKRDWLPVAVLGAILTISLIVFAGSFFLFPSGSPIQKEVIKTISKKPRQPQNQPKSEKIQVPKSESSINESAKKPATTIPQKSRIPTLPAKKYAKQSDDLIAFYPFNGNADDESGTENHGTVHGATPVEDRFGKKDSAYSFDGLNDYVDIGHPLVSGDFTISFWLKSNGRQNQFAVPISQGNMSYKGFNFTFTKGLYNGFNWGSWKNKKVSDPNWGNSVWHTIDFNFPKNINTDLTWHHLTATHKDNIIAVYRDGVLQGTASKFPINYGNFNFNIGRSSGNRDFNHRTFNGVIDDIFIYNRALSEAEITSLYKKSG